MNYFGTTLTSAGHFMFELWDTEFSRSRMTISNCPFNPEALPYEVYRNGETRHYKFCGFTILAICGSCKDTRSGSKSIFFIKGDFTPAEMKDKILNIPVGKEIIEQMPFAVNWNLTA